MRALSTAFVLLAVAVAAASLFWHPVRLESVPFRMGALPADLAANNRIAEHMQRFFAGQFQAPEHFTFDSHGNIYFSVHDGRILRVQVAPSGELGEPELVVRTGEASLADRGHPCGSEASENVCGRPLGMAIDPTNEHKLIVADCYLGLLEVDTREKSKKVLVNSVDGAPIYFANSVVVSAHSGIIYFTDSSSRWRRRDFIYEVLESQPTGRVISFDRRSGEARVLVQRVAFSNGILLDPANEQFLLFNELNRARVLRYDLSPQHMSGDGSGAIDAQQALAGVEDERTASKSARLTVAVANLPGIPDNLAWEQGSKDCFWIGAGTKRTQPFSLTDALAGLPLVRTALAAVLPKQAFLKLVPRIGLLFRVQLDAARQHGRVVDVLQDNTGRTALLTGAYEHDGFLYLGAISHEVDYLARLPWTSSNKTGATPSHTA